MTLPNEIPVGSKGTVKVPSRPRGLVQLSHTLYLNNDEWPIARHEAM